jgi:hypothetical protein
MMSKTTIALMKISRASFFFKRGSPFERAARGARLCAVEHV